MRQTFSVEERAISNAENSFPAISILLPFQPVMSLKSELEYKLKIVLKKIESQLMEYYSMRDAAPVLQKLQSVIRKLNFNGHKKSIAIFVSPQVDKVFYLDLAVEEKIMINESFAMRDLIYCKKETQKYLLLIVSGNFQKIYLGDTDRLTRIVSTEPENMSDILNDIPSPVANFSNPSYRKEVMLDKFMRHVDNGLSILLKAYPLPVFVIGTKRTIGHFKKLSKNTGFISDYVEGNFESATVTELKKIIEPYIKDWKKVRQQRLLKQLDIAAGEKKLAAGIGEVWRAASKRQGRLLVVERNYMVAASQGKDTENIYPIKISKHPYYIKDAVDDIIAKVLENGGDVEFVEEQILSDYNRIALTLYY